MRGVASKPTFVPHPLALLAAAYACGILVAHLTKLPLAACLACGAACAVLAIRFLVRRQLGLATLLVALAFFCAGPTLMLVEQRSVTKDRVQRLFADGVITSGDPVEVTGVLERAPEPAVDGFYLTLRVESLRCKEVEGAASGVVWLFAPVRHDAARAEYAALELRYGTRLSVMTALRRTENFRNPGSASFTEYLERRGYDATGTIKSPLLIERLDDTRVFLPLAWLYEWRRRLLAEIGRRFSAETAGVLEAALLGNRYHLSQGAAERFRAGGTFHVLVISGLHITFIGGLVLLIARRMTKRRAWQFALSILFLWAYTFAVGAESSVVRAALMCSVVALAPALHRQANTLNSFGAAALALLVWRPGDLFDPAFQLTFLSVLIIITFPHLLLQKLEEVGRWRPTRSTPYPPRCPQWWRMLGEILFWREREWRREAARLNYSYRLFKTPVALRLERFGIQRWLRYTFGALLVSACVQVGLLPVLVIYFHRLSPAALILNIWVGALMALLSLVALVALALSQLSASLAAPLLSLAEALNWLMVHGVDPFASAHVASIRLPSYTGWASGIYLLYYVPVAVLAIWLARWNPLRPAVMSDSHTHRLINPRLAIVALGAALVLIIAHPLSAGRPDGRLRVDFLDVGQGDAALITMPDGTTLLVDGGGRPRFGTRQLADEDEAHASFERDTRSIGEAVVSEYLWWRGLDQVDYLLATHADADHIDGLNDVARNFKVRAALVARTPSKDPEYIKFATTLQRRSIPVYLLGRGDLIHFGAVTADILWPPRTENADTPWHNNNSVVLRLRLGQRVFLLTGDIEKDAEGALTAAPEELHCDVVKVAHHGSKTSSTEGFVNAAHPSFAVISVGLSSVFGHPHKEVVERWRASGAEILTTGQCGTITISTDGHDLKIATFVKR